MGECDKYERDFGRLVEKVLLWDVDEGKKRDTRADREVLYKRHTFWNGQKTGTPFESVPTRVRNLIFSGYGGRVKVSCRHYCGVRRCDERAGNETNRSKNG